MSDIILLWPLAAVVILAFVFIRLGRKPKRHKITGNGDYAQDAARVGRQSNRHTFHDAGGGDSGGGGD